MTTNAHEPSPPSAGPRPRAPLWLLALFTLSGPVAMHLMVPALPEVARDLSAGAATMQLSISLYILGLAVGQLGYGPVSDRFGRRPVLAAGITLYSIAGLAAFFAPSVLWLIVARVLQALGGGAGMALSRAIVRDMGGQDIARRLALMTLMVTLGPGIAPVIGGLLSASFGWRSTFLALCSYGLALLIFLWRMLPETRPVSAEVSMASIAKDYWELLRSPAFVGYAIGGGCATTSMYAFIAAAPFLLIEELHRPPYEVGLYLGIIVFGFSIGTIVAARLLPGISVGRLLARSSLVSAAAAFFFLAAVLFAKMTVVLAILPIFIFTMGAGASSPTALTQALGVNPKVAGSASGIYGCVQMGTGALCAGLVSLWSNPALGAAIVLACATVVGQIAFFFAARRRATT